MNKTATILGATGLIGSHVLEFLKKNSDYDEIRVVSRRPLSIDHPKVNVVVIDFSDMSQFEEAIKGSDVVFCAIGTTQKKVKGDNEKYKSIDYDIPVNAATFCLKHNCEQFLLVSSVGADPSKKGFYLKLKGKVEEAIKSKVNEKTGFTSLSIFRPSLLLGNRSENRFGEGVMQFVGKAFKFLTPQNFKPIYGEEVAKSMVNAARNSKKGIAVYHYNEMKELN
ncbi:NAD(P)H-binding protein [Brumimicrobium aurantiacum]|nr:NAD(P)H-binding protein [Brumimicrobium aurantiacum]